MAVRYEWLGDNVRNNVDNAARLGLEETAMACVAPAKARVRVQYRILQGSIKVDEAGAQRKGNGWAVQWGSFDVNYAFYQEFGTGKMSAQPYLRPAADQEYPSLAARIRRRI